jgi:hypothetical protein
MMKFTMAVWAGGDSVVHSIRAAIGEMSDVMNFKEWITVRPTEWCGMIAYLTGAERALDNPVDYLLVPDKAEGRFFNLEALR